jgi:uncharacterized protein YlxW (UPF0749 family)
VRSRRIGEEHERRTQEALDTLQQERRRTQENLERARREIFGDR